MLSRIIVLTLIIVVGIGLVIFNKQITRFSNGFLSRRDAETALRENDLGEAILLYEKIRREDPANVEAATELAGLYARKGDLEKAEALYQALKQTRPKDVPILLGYARLLGAEPHRANDAVTLFRDLLRQQPGNPEILSALGDLYKTAAENPAETRMAVRQWLYQWAVYYYRLALRRDPERFGTRFNLGVVYQVNDTPAKAALQYCQALQMAPESYETRYNLGLSLVEMKAHEAGFRQLTQAVHLLSDQDEMRAAQDLAQKVQFVKNSVYNTGTLGGPLNDPPLDSYVADCVRDPASQSNPQ